MRRSMNGALLGLILAVCAGALAPAAMAQPHGTVVIGTITCFRLRVPDRGQSVQERVDHIQDMAAKYLGGDAIHLTIRTLGNRQHIDLNGEFLLAVTPDDARATGYKSAAQLAPIWRDTLESALLQSNARPVTPGGPIGP
jgi:hypothetical protein